MSGELNVDVCAAALAGFVRDSQPAVSGPHETAYGLLWPPTITYWVGARRVHLYVDPVADDALAVEIAERGGEEGHDVHRCYVTSVEQVRDIVSKFLCGGIGVNELSDYEWIADSSDLDKFISDPPTQSSSLSLAQGLLGNMSPHPTDSTETRVCTSCGVDSNAKFVQVDWDCNDFRRLPRWLAFWCWTLPLFNGVFCPNCRWGPQLIVSVVFGAAAWFSVALLLVVVFSGRSEYLGLAAVAVAVSLGWPLLRSLWSRRE